MQRLLLLCRLTVWIFTKNLNKNWITTLSQKVVFEEPRQLEYIENFRPGMGTENVGPFLRSMVQMLRPLVVLEVGAGYSTPFLLEGLINNFRVFNDGNLDLSYFENRSYDPKLIVVDDMSLGELYDKPGMKAIIDSDYSHFVEGRFQGQAKQLVEAFGKFDFVWFDCGDQQDYRDFLKEYWDLCSGYVFFHFTYSGKLKNMNYQAILECVGDESKLFTIVEPHKHRQGSLTMVNKNR